MKVYPQADKIAERAALPGLIANAKAIQMIARMNVLRSAVMPDRRLAPGIHVKVDAVRNQVRVVSEHPTPNVPKWQHDGTGIYGPRRAPIRPKNARMLAWRNPRGWGWVFAKKVKGSPPRKYLSKAAATVARNHRGVSYRER